MLDRNNAHGIVDFRDCVQIPRHANHAGVTFSAMEDKVAPARPKKESGRLIKS